MRIITGRAKGLRLKTPAGLSTRPTSGNVTLHPAGVLRDVKTTENYSPRLNFGEKYYANHHGTSKRLALENTAGLSTRPTSGNVTLHPAGVLRDIKTTENYSPRLNFGEKFHEDNHGTSKRLAIENAGRTFDETDKRPR